MATQFSHDVYVVLEYKYPRQVEPVPNKMEPEMPTQRTDVSLRPKDMIFSHTNLHGNKLARYSATNDFTPIGLKIWCTNYQPLMMYMRL